MRAPAAPPARSARRRRRLRRVLQLVAVVVAVGVGYVGVTLVQVVLAARDDQAAPAEAIVVLGAAQYDGRPSAVLRARLDHAVDLYREGVAPVIVVTGGSRPGDRYTEAGAASLYLEEQGVPGGDLRLETSSGNSWQSLAAAARILRLEDIDEVVLVSSPYHALRTRHIAAEVGLSGRFSPASGSDDGADRRLRRYLRETAAVAAGRVVGFRRLVGLDARMTAVRTPAETG